MKNLATIVLISAISAATPAFAASIADKEKDVQEDIDAIRKDNIALQKDMDKLDRDRGAKAEAKANDEYGKEAADSIAIGADKAAIAEKKAEKKTDQAILEHHQKQLNKKMDKEADMSSADTDK